jgi:hypothetical protein
MTWTQTLVPSLYFSQSVASSADGNKLAVAGYYAWGAPICLSTNAGATWVTSSAPVKNWSAIASSADGTKLAATAKGGQEIVGDQPVTVIGMIYTSTNAGATWMPSSAPRTNWYSIASSADGSKLVAAVMSGFVYTSTNSGDTWTKTAAPATTWYSVASSADGQKLLAVGMHSLYSSTDSGVTWISNNVALGWYTSACSADGNLRVVPASGNHIALSRSIPQPVLDIGSSPDSLAVSWIVPSTNFALQCATTCGTGWADVATPPVMNLTNLKYEVVLPLTNSMGFFRLESR